jgi:hypothetical protein
MLWSEGCGPLLRTTRPQFEPAEEARPVKKLVVLVLAGAAGFLAWKKVQGDQAEQDLWTEATNESADLR